MKPYINPSWPLRKILSRIKKNRAQRILEKAVARGTIDNPARCEHCQRRKVKRNLQGHHRDYRYPLRVIWLCQGCHIRAQGTRAMKRAAFFAEKRKAEKRFAARMTALKRREVSGDISRRQYSEFRRELVHDFYGW